jgi:hypothetical protein
VYAKDSGMQALKAAEEKNGCSGDDGDIAKALINSNGRCDCKDYLDRRVEPTILE